MWRPDVSGTVVLAIAFWFVAGPWATDAIAADLSATTEPLAEAETIEDLFGYHAYDGIIPEQHLHFQSIPDTLQLRTNAISVEAVRHRTAVRIYHDQLIQKIRREVNKSVEGPRWTGKIINPSNKNMDDLFKKLEETLKEGDPKTFESLIIDLFQEYGDTGALWAIYYDANKMAQLEEKIRRKKWDARIYNWFDPFFDARMKAKISRSAMKTYSSRNLRRGLGGIATGFLFWDLYEASQARASGVPPAMPFDIQEMPLDFQERKEDESRDPALP